MGREGTVENQFRATITNEGQITVPEDIRAHWNLKPGDQIEFARSASAEVIVRPIRRRSILDRLEEFKLPALGRPLTQEDIDNAVGEAMAEKEERSRGT